MGDDDPAITYSVKELLTDITRKLDNALAAIAAKADTVRVDAIEKDVQFLMSHVKTTKETASLRVEWRRWFIPVLLSVVMAVATIVSMFH